MVNLGLFKNITGAEKYSKGTIITDNMDAQMHIILKGEVGVFSDYQTKDEKKLSAMGPGEFYGETMLFLEKDMESDIVALTDVIVLPVYRNFVTAFIKNEPEISFEIMKSMCDRLYLTSTANKKLAEHPPTEHRTAPKQVPVAKAPAVQNAVPVPTVPPLDAAVSVSHSSAFSLFPEGHGNYQLPLLHTDKSFLMEKSFCCPVCNAKFKSLKVKPSRLIMDRTDNDMRIHYNGVEPVYYDIVICPNCLYSALSEMFETPDKPSPDLPRELKAFKSEIGSVPADALDEFSVFAGYYLALFCAPKCFYSPYLATAKLLLKLSWIYQDCKDRQMEEKMARQALDAYSYVYQNLTNSPKADQQLCMIIGELHFKLGDLGNAKNFIFKARSNREGIPLLRNKAADRITEIHELEAKDRQD